MSSAALEEGTRSAASAKGVDFALFNIPRIATLMPVDNERKHGGVAEPIRRCMAGDTRRRKEKIGPTELCVLIEEMC
jgi:hypothetical protein